MILIPQSVLGECFSVFRRALPKSSSARSTSIVRLVGGRDGIRLGLAQDEISVEYHHSTPSDSFGFTIPLAALADCQGRGNATVQFQPSRNGKVEIHREQAGIPYRREYSSRDTPEKPFPTWAGRDAASDPSLLTALAEAMQIPTGESGRLSLQCIQLRGEQGDVVATDGRQLFIQGGFKFPWKDPVLVQRTPVFLAKELPKGEVIRLARSKTHVFVRIDAWTIALAIQTATRFPNVDQVIPKMSSVTTRWRIGVEEAPALAAMLDSLPAAKETYSPVTLDLAAHVVVRARAEDEKRCTDVILPRSQVEGKHTRLATNRCFLRRALELGFREVQVTAVDKPLMCQDGKRLYVWTPLNPDGALAPQPGALRVMLPAAAGKSRRTVATPEPVRRPVPVQSAPRTPSRRPVSPLDGLVHCARTLWDLVRKHHREEPAR